MSKPSLNTLKNVFPYVNLKKIRLLRRALEQVNRDDLLYLIESVGLERTENQIRQMYNLPSLNEMKMMVADEILEGYGVEFLRTHKNDYDYVNMGDTYTITLLRRGSYFFVSTWGDIAEREGCD